MYAGAPGATCDYQHGETVNMIAEVHLSKIIGSLIPQTLHFFGGTIYRMFLSCVSRHTMLGSMSSEGGGVSPCVTGIGCFCVIVCIISYHISSTRDL